MRFISCESFSGKENRYFIHPEGEIHKSTITYCKSVILIWWTFVCGTMSDALFHFCKILCRQWQVFKPFFLALRKLLWKNYCSVKDNDIFYCSFLQSDKDAVQVRQSKSIEEIIPHLYDLAWSLQIYSSSVLTYSMRTALHSSALKPMQYNCFQVISPSFLLWQLYVCMWLYQIRQSRYAVMAEGEMNQCISTYLMQSPLPYSVSLVD